MSKSPARKLLDHRLLVKDERAEHLQQIVKSLPKPLMQHERAVFDLLIDRLQMLDVIDQLGDRIDILRQERDDAYENASQKQQAAMAKLRGELAVERLKNKRPKRAYKKA